nr:MAG TPA: hypothetical protein [Caudoviricetes sp.]
MDPSCYFYYSTAHPPKQEKAPRDGALSLDKSII